MQCDCCYALCPHGHRITDITIENGSAEARCGPCHTVWDLLEDCELVDSGNHNEFKREMGY